METPIALHSVANRVPHQIPAESEMSRQNRAIPPQIKVSHLSPERTFPPFAAGRGQGGCRGGLVEGITALLGSEKGSRCRGVSQLQSHQSRYSVQLSPWVDQSCADCPGFLVLSARDAPPPKLHPGASECSSRALQANSWICCPLPPTPKQDTQHMFLQHEGAHTEFFPGKSRRV